MGGGLLGDDFHNLIEHLRRVLVLFLLRDACAVSRCSCGEDYSNIAFNSLKFLDGIWYIHSFFVGICHMWNSQLISIVAMDDLARPAIAWSAPQFVVRRHLLLQRRPQASPTVTLAYFSSILEKEVPEVFASPTGGGPSSRARRLRGVLVSDLGALSS